MKKEIISLFKRYKNAGLDEFSMVTDLAIAMTGIKNEAYEWVKNNGISETIRIYKSL